MAQCRVRTPRTYVTPLGTSHAINGTYQIVRVAEFGSTAVLIDGRGPPTAMIGHRSAPADQMHLGQVIRAEEVQRMGHGSLAMVEDTMPTSEEAEADEVCQIFRSPDTKPKFLIKQYVVTRNREPTTIISVVLDLTNKYIDGESILKARLANIYGADFIASNTQIIGSVRTADIKPGHLINCTLIRMDDDERTTEDNALIPTRWASQMAGQLVAVKDAKYAVNVVWPLQSSLAATVRQYLTGATRDWRNAGIRLEAQILAAALLYEKYKTEKTFVTVRVLSAAVDDDAISAEIGGPPEILSDLCVKGRRVQWRDRNRGTVDLAIADFDFDVDGSLNFMYLKRICRRAHQLRDTEWLRELYSHAFDPEIRLSDHFIQPYEWRPLRDLMVREPGQLELARHSVLTAISHSNTIVDVDIFADVREAIRRDSDVDANQKDCMLRVLSAGTVLTAVNAPAGTGKTRLLAKLALHMRTAPTGLIGLVADTNTAAQQLLASMLRLGDVQKDELVLLRSQISRLTESHEIEAEFKPYLLTDHAERLLLNDGLSHDDLSHLLDYTTLADDESAHELGEDRVIGILLRVPRLRFVVATRSALAKSRVLRASLAFVLLDEAGQTRDTLLKSFLAGTQARVMIVGDLKLLAPHCVVDDLNFIVDGITVPCPTGSTMRTLARMHRTEILSLRSCYRACPLICQVTSAAFYGNELVSRRLNSVELPFPFPVERVPIVLLHTLAPDLMLPSRSRRNAGQEMLARRLARALIRSGASDVAVLTPYTGAAQLLQQSLKSDKKIVVSTVELFQGREASAVIFLMTRSTDGNTEFLFDSGRMTSALTRARDALVFIGNLNLVPNDSAAGRFIRESVKHTPIVGEGYVDLVDRTPALGPYERNGRFEGLEPVWLPGISSSSHDLPSPTPKITVVDKNSGKTITAGDYGTRNGTISPDDQPIISVSMWDEPSTSASSRQPGRLRSEREARFHPYGDPRKTEVKYDRL